MLRGNVNALQRDMVADHSCPVDGTTSVMTAFAGWKTWAQAQQPQPIDLQLPPVTLMFDLSENGAEDAWRPFGGIGRLRVYGNGATINSDDTQTPAFGIHPAIVLPEALNDVAAPIATVTEGSRSVVLSDIDHAARFSVGQWVMISAYDMMGHGWPMNNYFWEFNEITAISSTRIDLARPTRNTYLDTYPQYSGAEEIDQGGPAKIWPMVDGWGDIDHTYYDINIHSSLQQQYAPGRKVRYIRCTASGAQSPIPTQNIVWEAVRCNFSYAEVDKHVDLVRIKNSTIELLFFQSASILEMDADGLTGSCQGTPQHALIKNSNLSSLKIGPTNFGDSQTLRVDGGTIAEILSGGGQMALGDTTGVTKTDGVITWPKAANGPPPWAIPGRAAVLTSADAGFHGAFNLLDVVDAGTDVEIITDQPGGFPAHWTGATAPRFSAHPCLDVRFQNVTGCLAALSLSHANAQGRPLWSSFYQHLTGNTFPTAWTNPPLWGTLVEMRINVIQAYTGAQETLTMAATGENGFAQAWLPDFSDTVGISWAPTINLKVAGERVITPSGVTGAQSGDSLSSPGAIVFYGAPSPRVSAVISGEASNLWPIVEIEVLTDQGIEA